MEITELKNDSFIIIGISGRLDTSSYGQLEKVLTDHINQGNTRILVDCAEMDYVSSSGLRVLLMALKRISLVQGKFVICNLRENIREIFEISGFNSIFEIYPARDTAVATF
jgi:anti-sigma B factor antagonist